MNKPTKHSRPARYDYIECRDYLQAKHGYDERNYAEGKDFWHWVCKNYEIRNDCNITFTEGKLSEIEEEWVKTIYKYYIDEFGEGDPKIASFHCWW